MPLVYQQNINVTTKMGVWHISEQEEFFLPQVSLQRNITHLNKRLQHLAGRLLLKELYPDFPYELIRIADTRKPFLDNEAYHFSISHCGEYAAVIVSSDHRVGVDIELITNKVEKLKNKFLSEEEHHLIKISNSQSPFSNIQLLTAAWCIKETLYKWLGKGAVDFKEHLCIKKIFLKENQGIAHCKVLKSDDTDLIVHFLFFNENCISWLLTK